MPTPISMFNSGRSAAEIQSASYTSDTSKAKSFEQALAAASEGEDSKKIMEAAREFESYFIQVMLKEMRISIPKDGLIPTNNAEEIFRSMLDEEYAKTAASGKGIGIAQMIYEQMTRTGRFAGALPQTEAVAKPDDND